VSEEQFDEEERKDGEEPEVVDAASGTTEAAREFYAAAFSVSTPIAPPAWMREYNEIVPGSAKQMMDDLHAQSEHRRRMEEKEIDAAIGNSKRGQWMGYSVAMIAVVGGLTLAYLGKDATYLWLSFGGVAALAAVFVTGAWRERSAAEDNRPALPARTSEPQGNEEDRSG
jgi:uncharacterized membrane protein